MVISVKKGSAAQAKKIQLMTAARGGYFCWMPASGAAAAVPAMQIIPIHHEEDVLPFVSKAI
ncbi:MAG TPA: hypothetical protein VNX23_28550 [Bradyrhizobium sp.]|uniref:hypothetical protein n=1 Tax=Bradyrhizobium sp. TaxID=376 RepID=UPI002C1FE4AD|nr:hypothetical protein [Bradyrhizobium sp.]HXB81315.1 hypothetical protein [Bradyrhizobium sp.]